MEDQDYCEDVTSPSLYPPSTLLSVLLLRGEFNDPCNDVSKRGDGGLGLIDDCNKISSTPSASSAASDVYKRQICNL